MTFPEGLTLVRLASCASTNDWLKERLAAPPWPLPVLVVADEQTAGRGRDDRRWFSGAGLGLYASFAVDLRVPAVLPWLPLTVGTATAAALHALSGEEYTLKWPNDLLHRGRKAAGILVETRICGDAVRAVAGIGINLNQEEAHFPPELRARAVSLRLICGHPIGQEEAAAVLARNFLDRLRELEEGGGERIVADARRLSRELVDREISFHQGGKRVSGRFAGIAADGALLLQGQEGEVTPWYSGEISL